METDLRKALRDLETVKFSHPQSRNVLTREESRPADRAVLDALRNLKCTPARKPVVSADLEAVLTTKRPGGPWKFMVAKYSSATGIISANGLQCQVPETLRKQVAAAARATPRLKMRVEVTPYGTFDQVLQPKTAPSLRFAIDNGDVQVLQVVDPKAFRPTWRDPAIRDIEVYWKQGGAPPKSIKEMKPAVGGLRGGEYQAMYRYDPKVRTYYYKARWVYYSYANVDPPGKYGPWGPLLTTKQGPYVAPWVKPAGKQ